MVAHHRTEGNIRAVQFVWTVENCSYQKWASVDTLSMLKAKKVGPWVHDLKNIAQVTRHYINVHADSWAAHTVQ